MKTAIYNDSNRNMHIHSATEEYGVKGDMSTIKHLEERIFELPEGKYPWIKVWDHGGEDGLTVLIIPTTGERV